METSDMRVKSIKIVLSLTNSSSSGMRESKSRTSLFVTAWGRMILLENLMMPHIISKALIGIKCSTSIAPNNRRAVSQLSSGTEKLKVLKARANGVWKRVNWKLKPKWVLIDIWDVRSGTYFLTLSPREARNPIVFWTVWDTSWIACSLSLIVFFSSSFLSSSSSSSLPRSGSSFIVWTDDPVIHCTNQFLQQL